MNLRVPASLRLTVPLILLGFAAALSAVNLFYHVPRAERVAEEDARKHAAQEMSRLQSTLEYLLLKGEVEIAQREIAVLAHSHDYLLAVLTDDRHQVIAATRRAWLGRRIEEVLPSFDRQQAALAAEQRQARLTIDPADASLLGYAGILMRSQREELRPSLAGNLLVAYDLKRAKAEARAQVVQQSLYWAGWVTALALAMWLVFYFLLTRRTARLVRAAEQLAAGNLDVRGGLAGRDELARLSRAFDTMVARIADTQHRLRDDIAERARTEQRLRASEASYRAILDAAEDAVLVHDIDSGAIVDANLKACTVYGYSRVELLGIDLGHLGSGEAPCAAEEFRRLFARAVAGEALHFEWQRKVQDGAPRWDEVFLKRVTIGGQDRILALTRDITEKKHAAEELARQREALFQREKLAAMGTLLAGVAHELNNPLSVVVARSVLLEEADHPAVRVAAAKIRTAAQRCARIVQTFLAMARQRPPQRAPAAINDAIAAALEITGYALKSTGVEVSHDLAADLPPISADVDQLQQVIMNLIVNAQQALQEHAGPRRLQVSSEFDATLREVRVTVADSGPGIPAAVRSRIFEPYFTTKPIGVGTGVGLSVSLGIVEAHGGTLTVDCPTEGGTRFTVKLPVTALAPAPVRTQPEPPAANARRQAVLVVDDEADVREALREILKRSGHHVVSAASSREALEQLDIANFGVILTDLRMPDLDGRALYQEIQRRWPERAERVVFVTGDTLSHALRQFAADSGRPVLEKPFLPEEVQRVVAETGRAS